MKKDNEFQMQIKKLKEQNITDRREICIALACKPAREIAIQSGVNFDVENASLFIKKVEKYAFENYLQIKPRKLAALAVYLFSPWTLAQIGNKFGFSETYLGHFRRELAAQFPECQINSNLKKKQYYHYDSFLTMEMKLKDVNSLD